MSGLSVELQLYVDHVDCGRSLREDADLLVIGCFLDSALLIDSRR